MIRERSGIQVKDPGIQAANTSGRPDTIDHQGGQS